MRLSSDALDSNGHFDPRYTCDIDNSSPELRWEDPPPETLEFVLIAEDLDGAHGAFPHWLVYNIPKTVSHLPAGIPPQDSLPNGIRQGLNGMGKLGYLGPCPPRTHGAHRYRFRLYALRDHVETSPRLERDQLLGMIHPIVVATAELLGKYQRAVERAG